MLTESAIPSQYGSKIENIWIVLSDGCRLAACLWLPAEAEKHPVPAILEYLPYRKRDGTAERDALNYTYFAAHGYAGVRVDLRGSGESDGILLGGTHERGVATLSPDPEAKARILEGHRRLFERTESP